MIRLRKMDGSQVALPEGVRFVEICTPEGLLAAVVMLHKQGHVRMIEVGDKEFADFVKAFKIDGVAPLIPTVGPKNG